MNIQRAYTTLTIKSISDDEGIIEGIASTPTTDRQGDIVEPKGALFNLPMPLLWQHDAKSPIGTVISAKVTDAGIAIRAKIARGVLPEIDRAWALIKAGLVRGLSIGFQGLNGETIKASGGTRYRSWSWLELSAVTIPANSEATIFAIKSADKPFLRAASGDPQAGGVKVLSSPPGASGTFPTTQRGTTMKTIQEQIAAFAATREAKSVRMGEIMNKAAEEGSTLDEAQKEEYDTLASECTAVDEHIVRLKAHEAQVVQKATPITPQAAAGDGAVNLRSGVIQVKRNLPPATAFTRYAIALARSKGNLMQAHEISKQWHDSTPEVETVLKTAVASGDTTTANWATELADYTYMASEFIELLRPATIIGRIEGLRRVPFMIRMPATASGTSGHWVGQGLGKPLSKMDFDTVTLAQNKIATIVVMTEELVRFSNPAAEAVVRQDMIDAIAQFTDQQFIDPSITVSGTVRPASITNGAGSASMTGVTLATIQADIATLLTRFINGNIGLSAGVWVMHPRTALFLSQMRTAQDVYAFPGITMKGGTFYGMPVVASANMPIDTGNDTYIVLMDASEVFLADDGGVTLDVSREASVVMTDASGAKDTAGSLVSLWQNNMIGIRAERYCTWKRRRAAAVGFVDDVSY